MYGYRVVCSSPFYPLDVCAECSDNSFHPNIDHFYLLIILARDLSIVLIFSKNQLLALLVFIILCPELQA